MAVPFRAWLVGIRGIEVVAPGIGADLARLSRLVVAAGGQAHILANPDALKEAAEWAQSRGFDFTPMPYAQAPDAGSAVVHRGPATVGQIEAVLDAARTFPGHRVFWLGGHAVPSGPLKKLIIPTEGADDPELRVADLWELVEGAVGDGSHLVALLDTCNAGETRLPAHSRVLGLAGSRSDQKARGGPEGGAFTQALCEAIEHDHDTLRRARDFVTERLGGAQSIRAIGATDDWPEHPIVAGGGGSSPPLDALAPWRRWAEREHRHLPSVLGGELTQQVVVEVGLDAGDDSLGELRGRYTLGELLAARPGARFAVLGEPGSGKSTMARHLAWKHAGQGPIVAYLPAVDLTRDVHPFTLLAERVAAVERRATGIAEALERAAQRGELWLLIDGWTR